MPDRRARGRLEVHRGGGPDGRIDSGWLGKLYDEKADPGTTSFTPRPDWYFYFLFYLLRIFKWPDSVILGTVIVPTIALVLLLALPFLDVSRERRPLRRPVAMVAAVLTIISMGALTYKGATSRRRRLRPSRSPWSMRGRRAGVSPTTRMPLPGPRSSRRSAARTATPTRAPAASIGPDLTAIGKTSNRGVEGFADYVANPADFGNTQMPSFSDLGQDNLNKLGEFLQASQGPK